MKTFKHFLEEVKKPTGDLKKACWTGYTAVGTKKKNGRTVPNCVPEETQIQEAKDDDVGEIIKDKLRIIIHNAQKMHDELTDDDDLPEWVKSKITLAQDYVSTAYDYTCGTHDLDEETEEMFGIFEELIGEAAIEYELDPELVWENLSDEEFEELYETAAWQRKAGKDPKGGLNRKGIASYRREHPGSKLSMAVTTKPSKLKKGSKAAKRRKSFCARMSGMKRRLTSTKTARDPDSRINKALRKWNC